jgi:carotenoid cleavage dioxygenase
MNVTHRTPIHSTLQPNDHPYLNGAWTPLHEEVDACELEVIGTIPLDVDGIYLRNTENQIQQPLGRYHPFEGDGMVHMIALREGKAQYRNRVVQTAGFLAEQQAGHALWAGLMESPAKSLRPGVGVQGHLKDASSTDVVVHAGMVLSTFYQCGQAYQLDPYTLQDLGRAPWVPGANGASDGASCGASYGISAHCKTDAATGELLFFNYSAQAPWLHYGIVNRDRQLCHYEALELPGARLPHDMAFSEHYTVFNDLPLFADPELAAKNVHAVRFYPELKSRFGIMPRYGKASDVRWFEADPTYVLHFLNCYEDGDEVILDGYFQEHPMPKAASSHSTEVAPEYARMMAFLDQYAFQPRLHRWCFNLKTGSTREMHLDPRILEFGTFNQNYAGKKYRYAYSAIPEPGWFLFCGVVKHDLNTGESSQYHFGANRFGSEAPFAPRVGAKDEDDGYLISFVTDLNTQRSECVLLDAKNIAAGPVCRILLPHQISSGTHACWANGESTRWDQQRMQKMQNPQQTNEP